MDGWLERQVGEWMEGRKGKVSGWKEGKGRRKEGRER